MYFPKMEKVAITVAVLVGLASVVLKTARAESPAIAGAPVVVRSARSGFWSDRNSWVGGQVPGGAARVLIRAGHRIVYDVKSSEAIRGINVAGTLSFATDHDTRLDVGLIKIEASDVYSEEGFDCDAHLQPSDGRQPRPVLEVGSPNAPVEAGHAATIRLVYFDGMDRQSCPAIVCCGGRMDFHGAPMNHTWVKLGKDAHSHDEEVSLAELVTGWRVGDRIIVTATLLDESTSGTGLPAKTTAARCSPRSRTIKAPTARGSSLIGH